MQDGLTVMEMDDQVFDVVTLPDNDGENEPEPADPATEGSETGENKPEPADPAEESEEGGVESEGQTEVERRRQAAARRQAEQAERERARQREWQQKTDDFYARQFAGRLSPYNGKPIRNESEYLQYMEDYERDQRSKALAGTGLTPELINSLVEDSPAVKEAKRAAEEYRAMTAAARASQAQEGLKQQLREISALDPSIKTIEDLKAMDRAQEYAQLLQRTNGTLSLVEAYKTIYHDKLSKNAAATAAQATKNQVAGKKHLSKTPAAQGGGSPVTIPPDVVEMYKALNPGATDKEIREHYARRH